ncbi:dynamin family protein [Celeribacter sp. ULVN23_4]
MVNVVQLNKPAEAREPVRVAVVGEFNSGKSALTNLLLRRTLLESSIEPSNVPPLHIDLLNAKALPDSVSASGGVTSDDWEQVSKMPISVAQMKTTDRVSTLAPDEDFADVIWSEVSVSENGTLTKLAAQAIDDADFIIWCTMAQRAWCLSEIHIVEGIRKDILDKSILVINRADYLDGEARRSVLNRVSDLSAEFFPLVLLVDASARAIRASSDDAAWAASGGARLYAIVRETINELRQEKLSKAIPFRSSQPSVAEAPVEPPVEPAEPQAKRFEDVAGLAVGWSNELSEIKDLFAEIPEVEKGALYAEIKKRLDRTLGALPEESEAQWPLARTFRKAQNLLEVRVGEDSLAVVLALELRDRFSLSHLPKQYVPTTMQRNANVAR